MKFITAFINIIKKLCGKARWLLLAAVLLFIVYFLIDSNYSWYHDINGVCDLGGLPITEHQISQIWCFSINDGGKMAVMSRETANGIVARINLDTGVQEYCGTAYAVVKDGDKEEIFMPSSMTMTDDGEFYAYRDTLDGNSSLLTEQYSIFRISPDYRTTTEVFRLDIGKDGLKKGTKIGPPHYYNGKVYFSVSDMSGVKLYSIDTKSRVISESDIYPTDPDGTYTARVIPGDGVFFFVRSDGNVYKVEF